MKQHRHAWSSGESDPKLSRAESEVSAVMAMFLWIRPQSAIRAVRHGGVRVRFQVLRVLEVLKRCS
jgi:hypothetical protein